MHYHVVNTKPIRNYVKMANRNTGALGPEWVTISTTGYHITIGTLHTVQPIT